MDCKYPSCSVGREDGSKFCSTKHEVKYDHLKWDARDAKRAEEQAARERDTRKSPLEP